MFGKASICESIIKAAGCDDSLENRGVGEYV